MNRLLLLTFGIGIAIVVAGVVVALFVQTTTQVRLQVTIGGLLSALGVLWVVCCLDLAAVGYLLRRARRLLIAAADERNVRFVEQLDHQLKNQLQAINGAIANIEQGTDLSTSFQVVRTQVARIREVSSGLAQLASLNPQKLDLEQGELIDLVEEAATVADQGQYSDGHRVRLTSAPSPFPMKPLMADRDLLTHAILNVLDNGLKYSPGDRPVEVVLRDDGTRATIEVTDYGTGIDESDLPHVFEQLYRGKGTHGVEGSGLGLSFARGVVLAHGGDLRLRSGRDAGTMVTITLPLVQTSSATHR